MRENLAASVGEQLLRREPGTWLRNTEERLAVPREVGIDEPDRLVKRQRADVPRNVLAVPQLPAGVPGHLVAGARRCGCPRQEQVVPVRDYRDLTHGVPNRRRAEPLVPLALGGCDVPFVARDQNVDAELLLPGPPYRVAWPPG